MAKTRKTTKCVNGDTILDLASVADIAVRLRTTDLATAVGNVVDGLEKLITVCTNHDPKEISKAIANIVNAIHRHTLTLAAANRLELTTVGDAALPPTAPATSMAGAMDKPDATKDPTAFAIEVGSDTAMGDTLPPGSFAVCSPAAPFVGGDVYMVQLDDRYLLRRVSETENGLILSTENSDYPPQFVQRDELAKLVRVVSVVWPGDWKVGAV